MLPHYTLNYSNPILCLRSVGPHVWLRPECCHSFLTCHLQNLVTSGAKKKGVCGESTAHSPLFKEKRGDSKRHVSAQSNRSLALMVTMQLHRDRWDLSCCAEGCFSCSFWGLESTYHTIPPYRLFKRVLRVKPLTPWPPLLQCCCLK